MVIKALVSFAGAFSMYKGQVGECRDKAMLSDLLNAGYIEEVEQEKSDKNESKRNKNK